MVATRKRVIVLCLTGAASALAVCAAAARADAVYETDDPFGGPFGIWGFDVSQDQSVAVRFTPTGDYRLDLLRLWLWNNDDTGGTPHLTITLRNDEDPGTGSIPGATVYETWELDVPNTGAFNPVRFDFNSLSRPRLNDGVNYWIAAESPAVGGYDPVWAIAGIGVGFMSIKNPPTGPWSPAGSGAVVSVVVEGTPTWAVGDLNCDGAVNFGDIDPFVLALGGYEPYHAAYPACDWLAADCNADGGVDFADIDPFVALLGG